MSSVGSVIEFKVWHNTQRHPVVIYADFESLLLKKIEDKGMKTTAIHTHYPMSYGFIVVASNVSPQLLEKFEIPTTPVIFKGSKHFSEVAKRFVHVVIEVAQRIEKLFKTNLPIKMSEAEKLKHFSNTNCDLCKVTLYRQQDKIADHNHITGEFRHTLRNSCNLKLKMPNFVPCFFHNLSNYDAHFIVKELGCDTKTINVIPQSKEKYISFLKYVSFSFTIRFLDSYRFMSTSLDKLAKNLITSDLTKFRETAKVFDEDSMKLVTRKGVYPYEYSDSWDKMNETVLPPQREFHSVLRESDITDDEYKHAVEVWDHCKCQTLGEYSDLYLKIDILLLSEVIENFRDICISLYSLDPVFYFTSAGLSFDSMLKYTGIQLELLTDYDMLLMIEKGIRGSLSQASMRYAKANNGSVSDYDKTKPDSWIIYQDCNNLYGWAMSQYIPYGGFKWVEPTIRGLECLDETSEIGRIYEIDISYPQELHDAHNDMPFLPVNCIPPGSNNVKLTANFETKKHYTIHYRNLQQAMKNGLIVDKVHRVIQFRQSPWLEKYINLNTITRTRAVNDFEKDLYKLMNNSVFGKTMESMRKRIKMELVSSQSRMEKLINKPTFKYCTRYGENLAAITLQDKIINFCKPIYLGFAVLEISKTLMYDYHYNVMKKYYKNNIYLMYTDTDSLVYYILMKNFYNDVKTQSCLLDRMDTSDLPRNHPCYLAHRRKIPGFFSDEVSGKTMIEFVALRSKSYAFKIDMKEVIRAKGIKKHIIDNHMTLGDHKKCLFGNRIEAKRENVAIHSYGQDVKTITTSKLSYNRFDDKRYVLDDQIHTLAHGHYRINELMEIED